MVTHLKNHQRTRRKHDHQEDQKETLTLRGPEGNTNPSRRNRSKTAKNLGQPGASDTTRDAGTTGAKHHLLLRGTAADRLPPAADNSPRIEHPAANGVPPAGMEYHLPLMEHHLHSGATCH